MRAHPSARFVTLRPAAEPCHGTASALPASSQSKRGLLSGIFESVGGLLGFGNNQAHPADPKDTGNGGASSTGGSHEPTSVDPPIGQPSPPSHDPPASYPAPGGGGQSGKPTTSAPMPRASVSSASSSVGNAAEPAAHSTPPQDAINVAPTLSANTSAYESHHISDTYGGPSTSHTAAPGWPSSSSSVSSAPSPTDPPTTTAHAKRFPLAAAAAIGAVLGFLVVSALFWAVWLALRRRRRAYPEFASVHPKLASVPESVGATENPFAHPHDEKEDDPFDSVSFWRASTARSLASTMSV